MATTIIENMLFLLYLLLMVKSPSLGHKLQRWQPEINYFEGKLIYNFKTCILVLTIFIYFYDHRKCQINYYTDNLLQNGTTEIKNVL